MEIYCRHLGGRGIGKGDSILLVMSLRGNIVFLSLSALNSGRKSFENTREHAASLSLIGDGTGRGSAGALGKDLVHICPDSAVHVSGPRDRLFVFSRPPISCVLSLISQFIYNQIIKPIIQL